MENVGGWTARVRRREDGIRRAHRIVNTPANPASDAELVAAALAFANGDLLMVDSGQGFDQSRAVASEVSREHWPRALRQQIKRDDDESGLATVALFVLAKNLRRWNSPEAPAQKSETLHRFVKHATASVTLRPVIAPARDGMFNLRVHREFASHRHLAFHGLLLAGDQAGEFAHRLCACKLCEGFYLASLNRSGTGGGPANLVYCGDQCRYDSTKSSNRGPRKKKPPAAKARRARRVA